MNFEAYIASYAEVPWRIFFAALSFLWGASIGSFLNVCIYRIPRELSVITPRSFCPHCKRQIPWYYNVPILSFLFLLGKCRFCRERISPRYFLVEILVACLFFLVWIKFDSETFRNAMRMPAIAKWQIVPVYWLVVSGLVLGTFVDFEHLIIPDRVTLGGIVAGLALSLLIPELHGETRPLQGLMWSAVGSALGWGILFAIAVLGKIIFRKDAMGFGDVKLMGAIGAFFGWRAVLFTIMLSSLIGSIAGVTLVLAGRKKMQSRIPYGPYLALAALIWLFWGELLWNAYVRLLTPAQPLF